MALTEYRLDGHGRKVHKDLDALAVDLTKAAHENHGIYPDPYEIPQDRFIALAKQQAIFNGASGEHGGSVCLDRPYMNFVWRGVAVVPSV